MSTQNDAETYIGQGSLTNSKHPRRLVEGAYPSHIVKGYGCDLWDEAGNKYIDYICGLGTNLVGYGRKEVCEAIKDQVVNGISHSLPTTLETLFAREFVEAFGFIDKVKIFKTGTEACMAAVKIALASSLKKKVVKEGYHGWSSVLMAKEPPAKRIPKDYGNTLYRSDESFKWNEIAAYIVEPVITDWSKERIEYLKELRTKCTENGVTLIFDETITAYRFPSTCVAHEIGVDPDMFIAGKALGGGMPISVLGGKAKLMDGDYFVSGTFCGEAASIAAARAVMRICSRGQLEELWDNGLRFSERFNKDCEDVVQIKGYATRGVLQGHTEKVALFMQEAVKSGMLFGPSWFYNFFHISQNEMVLSLCKEIASKIRNQEVRLTGAVPKPAIASATRAAEVGKQ